MCYSFKTSIFSYSVGMLSAIFAIATRQYIIGMLILFFCQMQLSEAIIWKGIDTDNISLNKAGTLYEKYSLPNHNIAIGLGFILAFFMLHKKKPNFIPLVLGIIFYIVIVFVVYRKQKSADVTYPRNRCSDGSCQNMENRLLWPYSHNWYIYGFIISLIIFIIFINPIQSRILYVSVFVVSFLLCYYVYPVTVGSVWCFSAAILAPLLVLVNWLIIRNKPDSEILA